MSLFQLFKFKTWETRLLKMPPLETPRFKTRHWVTIASRLSTLGSLISIPYVPAMSNQLLDFKWWCQRESISTPIACGDALGYEKMTHGNKQPKNPKIKNFLARDKNFQIFKFGPNLYQIDLLLLGLTLLLGLNPIENRTSG